MVRRCSGGAIRRGWHPRQPRDRIPPGCRVSPGRCWKRPIQAPCFTCMTATIRPMRFHSALDAQPRSGGAAVAAVGESLPERIVESSEIEARLGLAAGLDRAAHRDPGAPNRAAATSTLTGARDCCGAPPRSTRAGVDPPTSTSCWSRRPHRTRCCRTRRRWSPTSSAPHAPARSMSARPAQASCRHWRSAPGRSTPAAPVASSSSAPTSCRGSPIRSDRGTAAVFADGAGAVVLVATGEPSRIGPVILGADGAGAQHIRVERVDPKILMAGHETFKEAVARLSQATEEAVAAARTDLDEIDLFVYHQANGRILSAVGERLGLPEDRVVDCIGEHGNTSAATLPLALAHSYERGRLRAGDRVLLGAFGAGFTWGATVLEWGIRMSATLEHTDSAQAQLTPDRAARGALRPRHARRDPLGGPLDPDGRQGPAGRRCRRRRRARRRAARLLLRPGRLLRRRLARRRARRDDRARARARRPRAGAGRRLRRLRWRSDAGGRRSARWLRADLPPDGRAVGQGPADLDHHRPLRRRRCLLAGADRLDRDDPGREHVPDRPGSRAGGARRGRERRRARRPPRPRAQRRLPLRLAQRRGRRDTGA